MANNRSSFQQLKSLWNWSTFHQIIDSAIMQMVEIDDGQQYQDKQLQLRIK